MVVGDVNYKLTGENPEMAQSLQCYDGCVYERWYLQTKRITWPSYLIVNRLDQPGIQYCFKPGQLPVFCTDSSSLSSPSVTIPTTTNNSESTGKFSLGDYGML